MEKSSVEQHCDEEMAAEQEEYLVEQLRCRSGTSKESTCGGDDENEKRVRPNFGQFECLSTTVAMTSGGSSEASAVFPLTLFGDGWFESRRQ